MENLERQNNPDQPEQHYFANPGTCAILALHTTVYVYQLHSGLPSHALNRCKAVTEDIDVCLSISK